MESPANLQAGNARVAILYKEDLEVRAGIEPMDVVSGVSSLRITPAQHRNITLRGSVRQGRANLYAYPKRVRLRANGRYKHAG